MLIQKFISWNSILLLLTSALFSDFVCATPLWKEVRFGIEIEAPPFGSRNANGEPVGLDIELGNTLCEYMKVRCVWVDQSYTKMIPALKANHFDVIMSMTPTEARKAEIDFTDVLYQSTTRLVTRKETGLLPTIVSLKGKSVGVLRGTNREAFALEKWGKAGIYIERFNLNTDLIASLIAKNIDATLQDSIEITEALLNKPEGRAFHFSGPILTDPLLGCGCAMGIRKSDTQLKAMLNQALETIKIEGIYQKIIERYLTTHPAIKNIKH